MKLALTIIISILQFFTLFLPIKFKIKDDRNNFPKNFTRPGWTFLAVCMLLILATIWYYLVAEAEATKERNELTEQLESLKKAASEKPIVNFCGFRSLRIEPISKDSIRVVFEVCTEGASAQNVDIYYNGMIRSKDGQYLAVSDIAGKIPYSVIPVTQGAQMSFIITPPTGIEKVFVRVKGKYTNSNGEPFFVDELDMVRPDGNPSGKTHEAEELRVRSYLDSTFKAL